MVRPPFVSSLTGFNYALPFFYQCIVPKGHNTAKDATLVA